MRIVGIAVLFVCIVAGLGMLGSVFNWCGQAQQVVQDEVAPRALLDKYMLLKEMHAQLEKKQADINVYKGSLQDIAEANSGIPRNRWAREDRDAYNQKSAELAGVKASYNDLASQYNAKMAEVNWSFCNQGSLPKGASTPLPREYAPYTEQ